MNTRKIMIILLILMFLALPMTFAKDGDYKIPSVVKDITVNDDGSTHISETIVYDIEGSVNGVYRDIPLQSNQSIRNISVKTPGYYNKMEVDRNKSSTKIIVWLYTDEAKTQKTKNAKVEVTYDYTIRKGVKIYNDIAELQYMTWGDDWNTKVDHLESNIHIPGSKDNVEYWNNPEDNVVSSQWISQDTLTTKLDNIGAHTSYEQRLLMPKDYFKNTTYAKVINMDAKDKIEEDQRKYQEEQNNKKNITYLSWIIITLLLAAPFAIYVLYGREPKIEYNADYEYDLPTDATPIQVNSLVNGDAGSINNDAVYATILDLIDKKYFKIVVNDSERTIIRQTNKDTSNLKKYELSLIEFLSSFAIDGDISIGRIGKRSNHDKYVDFKLKWNKQVIEAAPSSWVNQYFDSKGSKLLLVLAIIYGLLFVLSVIAVTFKLIPDYLAMVGVVSAFIFMFGSITLFVIPNTIPGRWTPKGKEFNDKWKNFERYIKDYSMIKERPPASVQVWGRYLVYAAALGCTKKVSKNMEQFFNSIEGGKDSIGTNNTTSFVYYNGFAHIESSFNTISHSEYDSDSGIGSSGGGGFGGGGGGTF